MSLIINSVIKLTMMTTTTMMITKKQF